MVLNILHIIEKHSENILSTLAYFSMRNENKEFLARKTDEKNEKMQDQKSSILEVFGGGNDRKFKIFFSYSAKSTIKWFLRRLI